MVNNEVPQILTQHDWKPHFHTKGDMTSTQSSHSLSWHFVSSQQHFQNPGSTYILAVNSHLKDRYYYMLINIHIQVKTSKTDKTLYLQDPQAK